MSKNASMNASTEPCTSSVYFSKITLKRIQESCAGCKEVCVIDAVPTAAVKLTALPPTEVDN